MDILHNIFSAKQLCKVLLILTVCFGVISDAHAGIIILNGLSHKFDVSPGGIYKGKLKIQNADKNNPRRVKIYQTDYSFQYDGAVNYDEPGSSLRSNAGWITYAPNLLTLQPREIVEVSFQIKVPDDSTLTGTYWSIMMVEGVKNIDSTTLERGFQLNTQMRYAIQVITNLGNSGTRALNFMNVSLQKIDAINTVQVAIENPGERLMKTQMKLELFDESGQSTGILESDTRKIYPGTSATFQLFLKEVPAGKYKALLVADTGDEDVYGVDLSLELKDD